MHFSRLVAAAFLVTAAVPGAAYAQAAAGVSLTAGTTIYGPQGGVVGTVEKVDGGNVIVNTGTHSATLPSNSFAKGEKGPVIGFSKAQLDAAVDAANQKAQAKLAAAIAPGAQVRSSDGVVLGTVKSIDDNGLVVIDHQPSPIALRREEFVTDGAGLKVNVTAKQVNDQLAQNASGAAATSTSSAASTPTTPSASASTPPTPSASTTSTESTTPATKTETTTATQ
jgi:preprotein translocase subunit YajC